MVDIDAIVRYRRTVVNPSATAPDFGGLIGAGVRALFLVSLIATAAEDSGAGTARHRQRFRIAGDPDAAVRAAHPSLVLGMVPKALTHQPLQGSAAGYTTASRPFRLRQGGNRAVRPELPTIESHTCRNVYR